MGHAKRHATQVRAEFASDTRVGRSSLNRNSVHCVDESCCYREAPARSRVTSYDTSISTSFELESESLNESKSRDMAGPPRPRPPAFSASR